MNNAFIQACLGQEGVKPNVPFPVPFEYISATFDLDNADYYQINSAYDDMLKAAFGLGEFYGRRKETHVYLNEPHFRSNGSSSRSRMSDSAGVMAMKYLTFTGRHGFCLAIKPKAFAAPNIVSHPLAFGMHGFHDGNKTLHVDKLLLPAFDQFRRHRGFRTIPVTSETLNAAQAYAGLCMEQIKSGNPIMMLENLRNAAPEKLTRALIGENVGAITPAVL